MTERWVPIPGWDGYYEVSDQGRVKSCARSIHRSDGSVWPIKERILKPAHALNGYLTVSLSRVDGIKRSYVHRLVLESFAGPAPEGTECCHWNGVRDDNRLCNLRWGTRSANMFDAVRHGTHPRMSRQKERADV